jgi:hypothetical protein
LYHQLPYLSTQKIFKIYQNLAVGLLVRKNRYPSRNNTTFVLLIIFSFRRFIIIISFRRFVVTRTNKPTATKKHQGQWQNIGAFVAMLQEYAVQASCAFHHSFT